MTFTGIFDSIRDLFSKTEQANLQKLKKTHFSFNTKGGRCEKCMGQGKTRISLDFVSDVWVSCDECKGQRYLPKVLECKLNKKNIFEVLEMTVIEAGSFFENEQKIHTALSILQDVGLGYLKLGQSTNTLSGGELQRLKLAKELVHPAPGQNIYLFDEPTTGLHFQDVEVLIKLFKKLVIKGHTLLITEHNQDIIAHSDWVIELGPEGGENGGDIMRVGKV
jgi:excinuclease ABC subunit A